MKKLSELTRSDNRIDDNVVTYLILCGDVMGVGLETYDRGIYDYIRYE